MDDSELQRFFDPPIEEAFEQISISRYTLASIKRVLEAGENADPREVQALISLTGAALGEEDEITPPPDDSPQCVLCGTLWSEVWIGFMDTDRVICTNCNGPMLRGSKRGL